jgi:DNA-binding NarL/FixJ family response regulator
VGSVLAEDEIPAGRPGGEDALSRFVCCALSRRRGGRIAVRVVIVDPHAIYRHGLAVSLQGLDDVEAVAEVATPDDALTDAALAEADVVICDSAVPGGELFLRTLRDTTAIRVVVCSSASSERDVLEAIGNGAVGYLCKQTLTPDALIASVRGAASGAGVVAPEALGALLRAVSRVSREFLEPQGLSLSRLTEREQQVLRLVAAGHPTREVARQLCYSERTIKNVLHDIVTKLGARSRSQAVAHAVREGLI